MSDKPLIERLRGLCRMHIPTCCEAADRIDKLETERKRFNEVLNDAHDVPPEHDSKPVPFHKGWELAIRHIATACRR